MVVWLYTCSRCKTYQTNRKENMQRHMNRKKPCPISTRKVNPIEPQLNPAELQLNPIEPQIQKFVCQHCNKSFSSNSHMHRHIRKSCKEFKLKQENVRLQEEIPSSLLIMNRGRGGRGSGSVTQKKPPTKRRKKRGKKQCPKPRPSLIYT